MIDYDELLAWISEKERGSHEEVRAAVEAITVDRCRKPIGFDMLDDLVVLGDIEAPGPRWKVCQPALSLLSPLVGTD